MREIPLTNTMLTVVSWIVQLVWIVDYIKRSLELSGYYIPILIVRFIGLVPLVFISCFFFNIMVTSIANIFIPTRWIKQNTMYHSFFSPEHTGDTQKPSVTVQIPVYKEGFDTVIKPTLLNVLNACSNYTGRSNIVVHDDGLIDMTGHERENRIKFYREHNICFIARPKEGRNGRFKKASNLNFGLRLLFKSRRRNRHTSYIMENKIKVGKYILLLDSDSKIPNDIFDKVLREMKICQEVGAIQCLTVPMYVQHDYWEYGIGRFTDHIYRQAFTLSTSSGNPAPLVGHNLFIRTSALKKVSWRDETTRKRYFWSEEHVSEDFDFSMRLQAEGFVTRYITYCGEGFMEGVSLDVLEEISRLKKYSYGTSEIMFNPIRYWLSKGIFGNVFKRYIFSKNISLSAKYNILAYMGTYYAMAFGPILSLINFFAYRDGLWKYLIVPSIDVLISVSIVFGILLPISTIIVEIKIHRKLKELPLVIAEEILTGIFLTVFFSGIGFHLLSSILSHLFGVNMTWSFTQKDISNRSWLDEFIHTILSLKIMFLTGFFTLGMILMFYFFPIDYVQISDPRAYAPLLVTCCAHILQPLLLNPKLMLLDRLFIRRRMAVIPIPV
ncbi:hypothetical protein YASMINEVIRUS_618 [Yasminevirus sp. GU-2018]|uniref:Glycosyltransferase 2-like domain-containing protein n=1 Tax=Yasminevirus sp. GU-2018 TaxID=2420051 RepID=A0A5K0U8N8_9VIRU|nr:hypothetical protein YASMINEVIRUS_618 [Yasminevirus sp. GU-2018]